MALSGLLLSSAAMADELLWNRILSGEALQEKLNKVYTPSIEEPARQQDIQTLSRREFSVRNQLPLMKLVEALSLKENDPKRTLDLETIVALYPEFPLNGEIQYLLGKSYLARYQENPKNRILKEKGDKAFNAFLSNTPQLTATLNSYPFDQGYIKAGLNLGPYDLISLSELYMVEQPPTGKSLTQALDALSRVTALYPDTFNEKGESLKLYGLLRQVELVKKNPLVLDDKTLSGKEKEFRELLQFPDEPFSLSEKEQIYPQPYFYLSMGQVFFDRKEYSPAMAYYMNLVIKLGESEHWDGRQKLLEKILNSAVADPEFEPHAVSFYTSLAKAIPGKGYLYGYWIPLIYESRGDKEKALAEYQNYLVRYGEGPDYVEKDGKFTPSELTQAKDRIEALMADSVTDIQPFYQAIEKEAPAQAYDLDYRIARLYEKGGQKEKALVLYRKFVKKYTMYPDTEESLFISRKTQKGIAKDRINALTKELNLEDDQ